MKRLMLPSFDTCVVMETRSHISVEGGALDGCVLWVCAPERCQLCHTHRCVYGQDATKLRMPQLMTRQHLPDPVVTGRCKAFSCRAVQHQACCYIKCALSMETRRMHGHGGVATAVFSKRPSVPCAMDRWEGLWNFLYVPAAEAFCEWFFVDASCAVPALALTGLYDFLLEGIPMRTGSSSWGLISGMCPDTRLQR